jgi:predicted nucleic acid-binding protein
MKLNVGKNDLRIAAIAIVASAIVVTRNVLDFNRIPLQ